jgi:hypothetical protein
VLFRSDLDVPQTHIHSNLEWEVKAQFVEQKLMLGSSLGVTKFIIVRGAILPPLYVILKSDLDVPQTHLRGHSV